VEWLVAWKIENVVLNLYFYDHRIDSFCIYYCVITTECSQIEIGMYYSCRHNFVARYRRNPAEPCSHITPWRAIFLVCQVWISTKTGYFHAEPSAKWSVQSELPHFCILFSLTCFHWHKVKHYWHKLGSHFSKFTTLLNI